MNLQDVRTKAQFDAFYETNGLHDVDEKIRFLTKEMGILFSRSDDEFTPDEELLTLQQYALYCWDRVSHS